MDMKDTRAEPACVVTGASTGIGRAMALRLADSAERLVLVARSADRLEALAVDIESRGAKRPLVMAVDLSKAESCDILQRRLDVAGLTVRFLINNAGYGLSGDVSTLSLDGQLGILDVNCRALTELTIRFLPQIVKLKGGILNVASVASFTAGPGFAVYFASKAYVLSFSRALRQELRSSGVVVTALCPGPTPTEFGKRAGFQGSSAIALLGSLTADDVAASGLAAFRANKAVVVPGFMNRVAVRLVSVLPPSWTLPLIARAQHQRRKV